VRVVLARFPKRTRREAGRGGSADVIACHDLGTTVLSVEAKWARGQRPEPLETIHPAMTQRGLMVHVISVEVIGDHELRLGFSDSA
jgi:hypothetical protein